MTLSAEERSVYFLFKQNKQKNKIMKWFSLFITVYFWAYTVFFLSVGMEGNTNALVMCAIMTFASLVVTSITIKNFKKA